MPHTPKATAELFAKVRSYTLKLIEHLEAEDLNIQGMASASPAKWHLAHTTWFFETFCLKKFSPTYRVFAANYDLLFNSYYNSVGTQYPRHLRSCLSRPTLKEVLGYRKHVESAMEEFLQSNQASQSFSQIVEIGINHEQQHQELILSDLKYNLSCNPLKPSYSDTPLPSHSVAEVSPLRWKQFEANLCDLGHHGSSFAFDNERPQHKAYVPSFKFADRLITNGEYRQFMDDGGYHNPQLWLSDGWEVLKKEAWIAPLYWQLGESGDWAEYTLQGLAPLDPNIPLCHLSYYEADAFARWYGARLASEQEWEVAASSESLPNDRSTLKLHPSTDKNSAPKSDETLSQLFDQCWQWTASPYVAYPGYRIPDGEIGEYNAKFMSNQIVLRGGSCITSPGHTRHTYRNFFYPHERWQVTGIRLAKNVQ